MATPQPRVGAHAMRLGAATVLTALVSGLLALVAPPAVSAPSDGVLLLIDQSGSMRDADANGVVRIDAARFAATTFARSLPTGTPLAVRAFPEGNGGCNAGEVIVDGPAPVDMTTVTTRIRGLRPGGDTPTAQALEAAADQLVAAGHTAGTVVLVSDGQPTCGGPQAACDAAASLEQRGLQLTVHTVGFLADADARETLACIARVTGGLYVDADDAQELADQLGQFSRGDLSTRLDYAAEVDLIGGTDGGGDVSITLEVANDGVQDATDVVAQLAFEVPDSPTPVDPGSRRGIEEVRELLDGDVSLPVVVNARRSLGSLRRDQREATTTWSFRPPLDFRTVELDFRVTVTTAEGFRRTLRGSMTLRGDLADAEVGPLLADQRITIMGDSYSSGEGGYDFEPGTDTRGNTCHRSPNTYLATLDTLDVTNVACSGAVAADLFDVNGGNPDEPAQVDQLDGPNTDAVVLTIGGNDAGLVDVVSACALPGDCFEDIQAEACGRSDELALAAQQALIIVPRSLTCTVDPGVDPREQTNATIDGLHPTLVDAYRRIDRRLNSPTALDARGGRVAPIVVLAYVVSVPERAEDRDGCPATIGNEEITHIGDVIRRLNAVVNAAVDEAASQGVPVRFVAQTADAFQPDRTYCDGEYSNIWQLDPGALGAGGVESTNRSGFLVRALLAAARWPQEVTGLDDDVRRRFMAQFHPTPAGYEALTAAILRWSTSPDGRRPVTRSVPEPLQVWVPEPGTPPTGQLLLGGASPDQVQTLQPAAPTRLRGSGLDPDTPLQVVMESNRTMLGEGRTDRDGTFDVVAAIPQLEVGTHHVEVIGLVEGELVVLRTQVELRPPTPWQVHGIAIAAVLAALLAAALARTLLRSRVTPTPRSGSVRWRSEPPIPTR